MMEEAVLIALPHQEVLGTVRSIPGLVVGEDASGIWLRGIRPSDKPNVLIASLPASVSYLVDTEGRIYPKGKRTPVGRLPALSWQPIKDYLKVSLPLSALPGTTNEKSLLKLKRVAVPHDPCALLTTLAHFKTYAEKASAVRLQHLRFAVTASGDTLIWGNPLPTLPGQYYWQQQQLLLPAGYDLDIPVLAGLISRELDPKDTHFLLFHEDGNCELIPVNCFVTAKRSAVRLTQL